MVAVLPVESGLEAALHCTAPGPAPDAAEVIVSHGALLAAVHCTVGSPLVYNVRVPLPPVASTFADAGLMFMFAPNCVMGCA
jgi:hypothetical protein